MHPKTARSIIIEVELATQLIVAFDSKRPRRCNVSFNGWEANYCCQSQSLLVFCQQVWAIQALMTRICTFLIMCHIMISGHLADSVICDGMHSCDRPHSVALWPRQWHGTTHKWQTHAASKEKTSCYMDDFIREAYGNEHSRREASRQAWGCSNSSEPQVINWQRLCSKQFMKTATCGDERIICLSH